MGEKNQRGGENATFGDAEKQAENEQLAVGVRKTATDGERGSRWRSRLMRGRAREMLVRSIKAMVYMTSATGMMRVQRDGATLVEGEGGATFTWSRVCDAGSIGQVCAGCGIDCGRARARAWYHDSIGRKYYRAQGGGGLRGVWSENN